VTKLFADVPRDPDPPLTIVTCAALEHARTLDERSRDTKRSQAERDRDATEAIEIRDAVAEVDPEWGDT
jgi:hypothetical protein